METPLQLLAAVFLLRYMVVDSIILRHPLLEGHVTHCYKLYALTSISNRTVLIATSSPDTMDAFSTHSSRVWAPSPA